ncbi:hypothetical protein M7I_5827 [Glarea lozoyensis 74030]|uniref:Uncharacterized protein n=1 Tax=Glarea lozoyensis (strain ATCC 74030 / MF5533) TaxID=1104152 RepID=H0ET09_GLAL7|nr:hypothetical protein M7I_5827 [Glarea lozoyensis 74030]
MVQPKIQKSKRKQVQLEKKRHPWAQYFKALVDVRSHSQDLQCTQSSASARLAILEDHHRFIEDFLSKVPKHTFTPNFEELGDNLRREQGSELKKHAARMRWNRFKAKFITKKAKAIVETSGSQGQAEEGVASKGAKKRAADDEDKHVPAKKQKATNEHVSEDSYDNLD